MHLREFMHVVNQARLDKNSDSDMPWKSIILEILEICLKIV